MWLQWLVVGVLVVLCLVALVRRWLPTAQGGTSACHCAACPQSSACAGRTQALRADTGADVGS
ncbi:MAG: hypothetical protein ACR2I0_10375 [Rhodoferax sp.]